MGGLNISGIASDWDFYHALGDGTVTYSCILTAQKIEKESTRSIKNISMRFAIAQYKCQ
jgi:hypothetical protein